MIEKKSTKGYYYSLLPIRLSGQRSIRILMAVNLTILYLAGRGTGTENQMG